jgi:prepilin-type N-terminal cleavage/methylation domain-containing protein
MKTAQRRQRGTTLLEVLISMAIVVVGMLGLYKAIGSATQGSTLANRFSQAQARAQQVVEAIRKSPTTPTNILTCLSGGATVGNWQNCEASCLADLGGALNGNATQSCVFYTLSAASQDKDKGQVNYAVVFDGTSPTRTSFVKYPAVVPGSPCLSGSCALYDVQVTIGWKDDGSVPPVAGPWDHRVTVHQVITQ